MTSDDEERALAHYLWPPQWMGSPPDALSGELPGDVVESAELEHGISVRVLRDGMIVFGLGPDGPKYLDDFEAWNATLQRLLNAYLACLHASLERPARWLFRTEVATVWRTMQVSLSGEFQAMSDRATGGILLELYHARRPEFARPEIYSSLDWRFNRGGNIVAIDAEAIRASFKMLDSLLRRPNREIVLLRAELLARAKGAMGDMDYAGALTSAWTAIEGILGDLFARFLDANADRGVGDGALSDGRFISAQRRRFLEGAEMTSRHLAEFLSLLDVLPFPLYRAVLTSAKARNNWLHTEKLPTHEDAVRALQTAAELFEIAEAVPLRVA